MRAIQITRNATVICVAGCAEAALLSVRLSGDCETPGADLYVAGMAELPDGHHRHLRWFDENRIGDGDELAFTLVETAQPTAPLEDRASNSPEYIADQEEYERVSAQPRVIRKLARIAPGLIFAVRVNGVAVRATLERARELIAVNLLWDAFHADRLRVSVSSTSVAEALSRRPGKDWLREEVQLGDTLSVKVSYHCLRVV
jgi:hypothetical protein